MTERPRVLVLGATGLFGGLLARRLSRENRFAVTGAGRGREALEKFSTETGADIAVMDRDDPTSVNEVVTRLRPFVVVDCAGPFQFYGSDPYRFARQIIEAGCHYIDIADDVEFVSGFTVLDALAKTNFVVAISGASSTPAISAAAADVLTSGMSQVVEIDTAIVPGNRTRRTYSVMKAILAQVGQPMTLTRDGNPVRAYGWSETRRVNMRLPLHNPIRGRLASLVDTPDAALFPKRYNAQTASLRAGLELKFFHRVLIWLGVLVRIGIIRSLAPLTSVARWISSGFDQFGSDVGGMQVSVSGYTSETLPVRRTWELIADDGRGPEIPTIPVSALLDKLELVEFGARSSPGEITLDELTHQLKKIDASTLSYEEVLPLVYKTALGETFDLLPAPIKALHSTIGDTIYRGIAESMGPTGLTGRLVSWIIGFPDRDHEVPVEVTITADGNGEKWRRDFAGSVFHSCLSVDDDGFACERFGPMSLRLGLNLRDGQLHYPVLSARLFGVIPLPRCILPKSIAHEEVDEQGRFVFDVLLITPFGGRIAHYRGWLIKQNG